MKILAIICYIQAIIIWFMPVQKQPLVNGSRPAKRLRPFSAENNQRSDGREPAFVASDVHLPVHARLTR